MSQKHPYPFTCPLKGPTSKICNRRKPSCFNKLNEVKGENSGSVWRLCNINLTMSCPPGFHLELDPELERHPLPRPPEYLKHQVYEKPDVFTKIDEHAIEVLNYKFYLLII